MGEAAQHFAEETAVWTEEELRRAEYGRYDIGGDVSPFQFVEVVAPKLIFHKDGFCGFYNLYKTARIVGQIEGKVAYIVDLAVILAYFVARWRKEGE